VKPGKREENSHNGTGGNRRTGCKAGER
jgi:hypothetical protein